MPASILSLSKARKAKARSAKEQQAAENRIAFGRNKAEKAKEQMESLRAKALIEAHKLDSKDNADG
jgi:Domain of unknown function (DUF4169)